MRHDDQGNNHEVDAHEEHHEALPAPKRPAGGDEEEGERRHGNRDVWRYAEIAHRETHPNELGDDDEKVEQKNLRHRVVTPATSDALAN